MFKVGDVVRLKYSAPAFGWISPGSTATITAVGYNCFQVNDLPWVARPCYWTIVRHKGK